MEMNVEGVVLQVLMETVILGGVLDALANVLLVQLVNILALHALKVLS